MIVFCHLLNDSSGSPQVLRQVIEAIGKNEKGSRIYIGSDGRGVLEAAPLPGYRYWYWRTPWKLLTLVTFLISQLCLFLRLVTDRTITRDAVIYVNTLLPFGAAIYGKLTRRRVIYHLHEVSISPAPLRYWLTMVARHTANHLIYVSDFHRRCLPIPGVPASTVYNSLPEATLQRGEVNAYRHRDEGVFTVLMLASARDYKGVPEFLALADRFKEREDVRFELVLNDEKAAITRYLANFDVPMNVAVHSRTDDPAVFYEHASLVVNLSRPDLWEETFGLTLLEAMAFGIPVIAPPVGGPVEIVEEGVQGYLMDCRDQEALYETVADLADNEASCMELSRAGRQRASEFSPSVFAAELESVVYGCSGEAVKNA